MTDWEGFYREFRKPDFISGYEIQHHLGRGAFGEVYKSRKSSIGKPYAIKFLRLDEEASREAVERELEHVRLFAAIDHPNLVTIEDMGVVFGVPYLVMGYAGEDTLARRIKRGDLDRERALRYFVQACRGVLALHDRRLAHFDLKPSNIFIRGEVARVGDYGLAKLLTEGRATLSFGRGTPMYMAPEMLKNRGDQLSDVYSLGVILFESLALRLPYGEGAAGVVVREDDVPPEFPGDFPLELRAVVERCLRIDPKERFGSVYELLEALGQTARPGDSVRVRFEDLPVETREFPEKARAATPPLDSGGELRAAAVELARGAVGLARGVWDGVLARASGGSKDAESPPAQDAAPSERSPPAVPPGGDVISVSTLSEPDEPSPRELGEVAAPPREAPWRAELERARARRRGERPGLLAAAAVSTGPPPGTVPVPPRAEGGWLGGLVQSAVVGAEIMGALVTGPLLVGLRAIAAFFDRVLRGVPGFLGGTVRLILLMVFLALLGGLASFLVLALFSFGPWISP